ncbi:prolyl oligopeptidase family serine peptidase [Lawsonibacter faecis]|uniref:Prolyl oligopeptidase family serine peptidase n=1 Tax=Lawsonibacter faecis TaxID=2763052 RepID=A0A8J6MDW6_9FIRM|nr:prolyl oligopeptidase family serine peptidase [Lawsonibacter faecis]MBC5738319.1 prolyl oligopeptidase family serine peptidase [Lawsonibacter faecis]
MNFMTLVLTGALLLSACAAPMEPPAQDTDSAPAVTRPADEVDVFQDESAYVTGGDQDYEDFTLDHVLHSDRHADIHYNLYVPESYDGSRPYAIFFTLPGWEGLYFQGVGMNIRAERFGFEAQKYHTDMIVVAPQLSGWGETSADETIALVEYFLSHYNIDRERVYLNGFSGGGETLSLVLAKRPELFTAALHCSSQWDGDLAPLAESRTPLYLVIGESDEYYGSQPAAQAYDALRALYTEKGLTEAEISALLVLDVKDQTYFTSRGLTNQHMGGGLFASDEEIMGWLFGHGEKEDVISLTSETATADVVARPAFEGFGQFLFPLRYNTLNTGMTLSEIDSLLPYHDHIRVETTIDVLTAMEDNAVSGARIFYDIYSDVEKAADPIKENTGLFFFRGDPDAPFAIVSAGGGFSYVGSIHESFPHALELSRRGYNAFALQYRTGGADVACEDLAAAISFVFAHAGELGVSTECYSLWGGSAGARMAAYLGSYGPAAFGGDDLPRPGAVVMQYTGHSDYTKNDPPTYVCVGEDDGIASWRTMEQRTNHLKALGIETEFHKYPDLGHGFGLGIGTSAEGWLDDALAFWQTQIETTGGTV